MVVVKFLTISEFARASRLSPKALRLYDELGLLPPSRVDQWSGYRYYAPSQLEQARLIAWLRRLGMPLAAVKEVAGLPPAQAAARVAALLRVAEAEFAERKELAESLISYLSGKDTAMTAAATTAPVPLTIRYAASGQDPAGDRNQDVAYAGSGLLAVADLPGPAGEQFGVTITDSLRQYSEAVGSAAPAPADVLNAMSDALTAATATVRSAADAEEPAARPVSTLTAMLWYGSQLAFVHLGDARAYLLRDGSLFQITHDDSALQPMIDDGRLTPEEAVSHPQRSLLLTALDPAAPTLSKPMLRDAQAGDRYLLCTDGLADIVPVTVINQTLRDTALSPHDVVARLINAVSAAGTPDNVACTVADVMAAA